MEISTLSSEVATLIRGNQLNSFMIWQHELLHECLNLIIQTQRCYLCFGGRATGSNSATLKQQRSAYVQAESQRFGHAQTYTKRLHTTVCIIVSMWYGGRVTGGCRSREVRRMRTPNHNISCIYTHANTRVGVYAHVKQRLGCTR